MTDHDEKIYFALSVLPPSGHRRYELASLIIRLQNTLNILDKLAGAINNVVADTTCLSPADNETLFLPI